MHYSSTGKASNPFTRGICYFACTNIHVITDTEHLHNQLTFKLELSAFGPANSHSFSRPFPSIRQKSTAFMCRQSVCSARFQSMMVKPSYMPTRAEENLYIDYTGAPLKTQLNHYVQSTPWKYLQRLYA